MERKMPGRPRSEAAHQAILRAAVEILAEAGFDQLSIEKVAARAGVAKTTIYRRWASKTDLVIDAFVTRAAQEIPVPDTGSLRSDLVEHLRSTTAALSRSESGPAVAGLIAAASRDPAVARAFRDCFVASRRAVVATLVDRAVARGETGRLDVELLTDLLVGPLYYRVLVSGQPVERQLAKKLVDAVFDGVARKEPARGRH